MTSSELQFNSKLAFPTNYDLTAFVNHEVVSRYLLDGTYAIPGSQGFIKGVRYGEFQSFSVKREGESTLDDLLSVLLVNVEQVLEQQTKICLCITSGLDSYLLYLLFKIATKNFSSKHEISFITGRFDEPYDEVKLLSEKSPDISIHSSASVMDTPSEVLRYLNLSIKAADQPVNGLVASAVFRSFSIASSLNASVVLGTGDSIFFGVTQDFLGKLKARNAVGFASDNTISGLSDYLTPHGQKLAELARSENDARVKKVFNYDGEMEKFIHDQQFLYNNPRVDFETSSYSSYFNLETYTPFRCPRVIETFLSLPKELQHDGRPKTAIRMLIEKLDNRVYPDGMKMISPQREFLRNGYANGGFAELVEHCVNNSILVDIGLVDQIKITKAYGDYKAGFDESKLKDTFVRFSSYNIWKFFVTELWLRQKKGSALDFKSLGLET